MNYLLRNRRYWVNWCSFALIALMWMTRPEPWRIYLACMIMNLPFMASTFIKRLNKPESGRNL